MAIVREVMLSSYFVQYVLSVVLMGILSIASFQGRSEKRKNAFRFLILTFLIIIFAILDFCRVYFSIPAKVMTIAMLLVVCAEILIFVFSSIKAWKLINKKLFLITLILASGLPIEFGLSAFLNISSELAITFTFLGATLSYFFLIISFLINAK